MADDLEKTEEPTPKKLEDARKEGNVPKSMDFNGFVVLLLSSIIIIFYLKYVTVYLEDYFKYIISLIGSELTYKKFLEIILKSAEFFFIIVLPVMFIMVLAGIIANVVQIGFLFTIKPIIPKFEKLNPIKGLKKIFSGKTIFEGIKITLKVFIAFIFNNYYFLFEICNCLFRRLF